MTRTYIRYFSLFLLAIAVAAVGMFTDVVSRKQEARAQSAQAALYCAAGFGLQYINGFCVKDLGFLPTQAQCPEAFGPVSFGGIAGCGGASAAAFASARYSSLIQDISQNEDEAVYKRARRRIDQQRDVRLAQFAALGNITYTADLPTGALPAAPAASANPPIFAVWAQGGAENERVTASQTVALSQRVQVLNITSNTNSANMIGGVDAAFSNVLSGNDSFVVGVNAGYQDSRTRIATSTQRTDGASVGVYTAYSIAGFTLLGHAKVNFLNLNSIFTDFRASAPFGPVSGSFSTPSRSYSVGGALSYRFNFGGVGDAQSWFIEPTVGLDNTNTAFRNATALGLGNSTTLRGRLGATMGTLFISADKSFAIQPQLSAFVFSNLKVNIASLTPSQTDEGKARGQLDGSLNFIFANGLSFNVGAEYRFAHDLQAYGARAGFRYRF